MAISFIDILTPKRDKKKREGGDERKEENVKDKSPGILVLKKDGKT